MDSQNNNTRYIIGAIIIIVLILGGYALMQKGTGNPSSTATSTSASSTDLSNLSINVGNGFTSTKGYTITTVPVQHTTVKAPDFNAPVACPSDMPADECSKIKTHDAAVVALLQQNQNNAAAWTDFGSIRKQLGDYNGAIAAWNYVAALAPQIAVPYYNLGDLYLNFVKDYPKAEKNYLLAAKYAPTDTSIYMNLLTLYTTTTYHPTATAAEDILKKGIAANPKATDLQVALARYYKSAGRSADAKAEYEIAAKNADQQGLTDLAAGIRQEEATIH